ncbi:MAG TPA: hypothetical protein PKM75_05235 [Prolixibacteraceae bacterium]|nr:hypothetical protein [Prolixibacteraceae bacterium]
MRLRLMMDAFGARRYPILVEEGGISRGTSEMTVQRCLAVPGNVTV